VGRVCVSLAIFVVVGVGGAWSAIGATASSAWKTFGNGTYRVGRDVPPGTYRSRGEDGCYWARLRGFSGELKDVAANENAAGPTLVTLLRSDKGFESNNCARWTSNLARITKSKTRFGQGIFIVRTDIAPGTYRSGRGGSCYWARLRSFTGSLSSIIANGNASTRRLSRSKGATGASSRVAAEPGRASRPQPARTRTETRPARMFTFCGFC
jgi:hypothetical protein